MRHKPTKMQAEIEARARAMRAAGIERKSAASLRVTGVGLAPALRTRQIEQIDKPPARRTGPRATGPGGVALKLSGITGGDVVVALNVGTGADLGTVDEWLDQNGHGQDRRNGLARLFLMHRAGTIGFRAAEGAANG